MKFIDLASANTDCINETAGLLLEGFRNTGSTAWKTREQALRTVEKSLDERRISRVALDTRGDVLGWIAGMPRYDGRVWEIHPLVVRLDRRHRGIGRALVADLECEARKRQGLTLYLGSDDENARTTIGGVDLYPGVLRKLAGIESRHDHPFEFYRRMGFEVVGVVPDANGFGKPDILMAKRIGTAA